MPEVSALNMTEEEILSLHGECINDISDEMYAVWQKMIENNAYKILDPNNRFYSVGSGVNCSNQSSDNIRSYLMIGSNPEDPQLTWRALHHEFGHYNNSAYVPKSEYFPYDISEINSSGLENLFTHYYDRIYGDEADTAELQQLSSLLWLITAHTRLQEFQHIIYSEPDLSVEKLNEVYCRVNNEYGYEISSDVTSEKALWIRQSQIFIEPFYSISYVTSYTATLELWGEKEEDFYAAADKYLRFAALEENEGVIKMLEKGGYGNVFEEDTVRKTAESIDRLMGYGIWSGEGANDGADITSVDGFEDVPADAYYRDAVNWAYSNSITSGTDETHFSPSDVTTRAQMVTFLWRTAGSPEPELRSLPFLDVRDDYYYYKAVLWAVEKGIVNGISENEFAPDTAVSRAQTVTFLYRYEGMDTMEIKENPFSDVADGQYYTDAVLWANARNITNGTGAAEFSPDAECQRAQIVTFLYRYFGQN